MNRTLLVLAAVVGISTSVAAQSKKYPPRPPDRDREAEQHSHLWEATMHPERRTYDDLVSHARPIVKDLRATTDRLKTALVDLDKAVALEPKLPDAYELRGIAHAKLLEWAPCADDLATAEATAPAHDERPDRPDRNEQRRDLGTCQARAGRYTRAEQTLALAVANGARDTVTLMRLGETRIALGKLDEAITALTAAIESEGNYHSGTLRWLLAAAYDRARMPNQAAEQLLEGYRADRAFGTIRNPSLGPLLGDDEADYLLALAWGAAPDATVGMPSPELQLAYFRRYLKKVPNSPWKKRAEEHVRDLGKVEFPETIQRRYNAPLDLAVARTAIRKGMPAMRACLAHVDGVMRVTVVRAGPRTPPPPIRQDPFNTPYRGRPAILMSAPPGTNVVVDESFPSEAPRADVEAAIRCVEALADKLALPAITEKDSSYGVVFSVIGS